MIGIAAEQILQGLDGFSLVALISGHQSQIIVGRKLLRLQTDALAQMGRSDLANAKIAGLDTALHLTPGQYTTAITVFIAGYVLFQPAGTLFLRALTPPVQLGGCMLVWGVVTVWYPPPPPPCRKGG